MQTIDGQTQVYGIIGNPVSHSLSPLFQNRFLQQGGVNAKYLPFPVEPQYLESALSGLHAANIQGLNITIPHKENVLPWVKADQNATIIGAANTLRYSSSAWEATNTDWVGFADVIQGLQVNVHKSPVFLFGAGGTSRAILHALNEQQIKRVFLCNRNKQRAEQLISDISQHYPSMNITATEWEQKQINKDLPQCALIINSTSIGLKDTDNFPFELLGKGSAVDAVYKPTGKTAFGQAAAHYNTIDGLPMLIAQGIASLAFWFENDLQRKAFSLPNKLESLHWVEQQLNRNHLSLPGWRK